MEYYAFVQDEIVTKVIVADPSFFVNMVDDEPGEWVQTYKDGTRQHYAGKGSVYNKVQDAFYAMQPYPSWTLDETTYIWEPPVPYPVITEGETTVFGWSEAAENWIVLVE